MAMTNAEKQRAFQKRRKERIEHLTKALVAANEYIIRLENRLRPAFFRDDCELAAARDEIAQMRRREHRGTVRRLMQSKEMQEWVLTHPGQIKFSPDN